MKCHKTLLFAAILLWIRPGYASAQQNKQEPTSAIQDLTNAAKQGRVDAQMQLGLRYLRGNGVSQDYAEAVKWLQKAAEQGNSNAQDNLFLFNRVSLLLAFRAILGGMGQTVDSRKSIRMSAEGGN